MLTSACRLALRPAVRRRCAPGAQATLLLLDEVHTYSGTTGAQAALLLAAGARGPVRPAHGRPVRTLRDAPRFFASLTGLSAAAVEEVGPLPWEVVPDGMDT